MHRQRLFFRTGAVVLFCGALLAATWCRGALEPESGTWRAAGGALAAPEGSERVEVLTLASDDQEQRLVFRFPAPEVRRGADGLLDVLLPSADSSAEPGLPVLPLVPARVAVPQGHEVVSLEVIPAGGREYALDAAVRHAQAPHPVSHPQDALETPPDTGIYASDAPYPAALSSAFSVQTKRGVAFADFVLYPVVYRPASGRLTAYETLTVQMVTRPAADAGRVALAADAGHWRARFRSDADALAVAGLLDNPEALDGYRPEQPAAGDPVFRLAAGELPADAADTFHHVIITSQALRDSILQPNFNDIVALRAAQGLPSVIVTVEDILAVYPGADDAASVRSFIRDAYDKWDTEYVLLGGSRTRSNRDVVPIRRLYASVGTTQSEFPSDLYFQCLDGSFDSNNNGLFGEPGDGADRLDGRPGADVDLYAEVVIGRIPVTDEQTLANWAAKQIAYETDRLAGAESYLSGALMIGEHLRFGGVSEYAEPMLEEIRLGAATHGYRTRGFAESDMITDTATLYDSDDATWSALDLARQINRNRFSLLNHIGHASSAQIMKFQYAPYGAQVDVRSALTNSRPAFLYSQGCGAGDFSSAQGSMAGLLLGEIQHGLFGGVFNSAFGWGMRNSTDGPSQRYNRWFWQAYVGDLTPDLGYMSQQSRERNAGRVNEIAMRWVYYTSNLLGDPAQRLYGIDPSLRLDRRGYRTDASAVVEVLWPLAGLLRREMDATLELFDTDGTTSTGFTNLVLRRVGSPGLTGRYRSDPVALADLGAVNGGAVQAAGDLTIGTNAVTFTDRAKIDDDPPVVSNLRVSAKDELWMDVAWDADEPVTGAARLGTVLPLTDDWTFGSRHATEQVTIRMAGLAPFTRYHIAVRAEDEAGNVTFVPADLLSTNAADYLTESTIGREPVARHDWNRGTEMWTVTNLNGEACWEYGEPYAYGPQDAGRCWGTILNGRYPDGAHARLTSPPFTVRNSPLIRFRHWHDMQYSPDMPGVLPSPAPFGDYGQVEVLSSGVWHNVTMHTDIADGAVHFTGRSGGWRNARLTLPPGFENQTLAMRFRFVSDQQQFLDGNPAGWYVDDVLVSDMPGSGIGISRVDVDDVAAGAGPSAIAGLSGDADFLAEAGETVALRPHLHNYGGAAFGALSGSLTVLVDGDLSDRVELLDGAPAAVAYAPLAALETAPALAWTRLRLSPLLEPGTVITILQTVTNIAGQIFESRYDMVVQDYATIRGRVEEFGSGDPIALARVDTVADGVAVVTTSGADGSFELHGLATGTVYAVTASKAGFYTPESLQTTAPASDVVFVLGRSDGSMSPASLVMVALSGETVAQSLTFTNALGATAALRVDLAGVNYGPGERDWLTMTPESLTVATNEALAAAVTADATTIRPGNYYATLALLTDGPGIERIDVPVALTVLQNPDLEFGGAVIAADDNGNGRLESGETCEIWIHLVNRSGLSEALDIQGVLESLHPNAVLTGSDAMAWTYIPAFGASLSDNGVELALDPGHPSGEALDFRLTLTWDAQTNIIEFTYIPRAFHNVDGVVEVTAWAADPADQTISFLAGAVVTAEDGAGVKYVSRPTDTNGYYFMENLPAGDLWFTVAHPSSYPYTAPAGRNVFLDAPATVNFMMMDYSPGAPRPRLFDVIVDDSILGDGDGSIDPGERFHVRMRMYNAGLTAMNSAVGQLAAADMGAAGPFMTVNVDTSAPPATMVPLPSDFDPAATPELLTLLGTFEVEADAGAVDGDRQRFSLTLTNADDSAPGRFWPFDFSLAVEPRRAIGGTVMYSDPALNTPEHLAGLRILVEYDGESGVALTGPDGAYRFIRLPVGAAVTVLMEAPDGFDVVPQSHAIASLDADVGGLDFVLMAAPLRVTPSSLAVVLPEGSATNRTLLLENEGVVPLTVDLTVSYKRGMFDVMPPATDPLTALLAGYDAQDWDRLDAGDYVDGEIEIRFAADVGWRERSEILERHGLRALFHFDLVPACVAVQADSSALSGGGPAALAPLARALSEDPRIMYVQPSAKAFPQALPNDPLAGQQYALRNIRQTGGTLGADINVEPLWDRGITGSRDIIVAVYDTGMDLNHEDLVSNVWRNPLEQPGDANQDGYPGVRGVDDDGDAESSRYHINPVTGALQGPELVDPRFETAMWADVRSLVPVPGRIGEYEWRDAPNNIPDFFEPYLLGASVSDAITNAPLWHINPATSATNAWGAEIAPVIADVNGDGFLTIADLLADARFADSNGDGIPDIFADSSGDGTPDIFGDEDGDGLINETGIDFRDQNVMKADYYGRGRPLVIQKFVTLPWIGGRTFKVLAEQWDLAMMPVAAMDDDENGYRDDFNGWNFGLWGNWISDLDRVGYHGTHVAGIIGAAGDNGLGMAGVNWEVSLMPLPIVNFDLGITTFGRIAKAMEYALKQGARVSNHSWSGTETAGIMFEVMKIAERDYNHLFVISAGNGGENVDRTRVYPAYLSTVLNNVITVAASDHDGQLASFSGWGPESVQIAAPGVDILGPAGMQVVPMAEGEFGYAYASGASMAAPHVAGAAALLWSHAPSARYDAIRAALLEGARPDPNLQGLVQTGGHLDVARALEALGRDWLELSTNRVELAPLGSEAVEVAFNPERDVRAGIYEAEIVASYGASRLRVPVTMTVYEQPVAGLASLRVADAAPGGDGDGYAEPGETVDLFVTLRNTGGGTFADLSGTLAALTPGVTVTTGVAAWDYLYSGDTGESLTAFRITLPVIAPDPVELELTLTATDAVAQTLAIPLPAAARHTIRGRVADAGGAGVADSLVEYRGAAGGSAFADAGGYYELHGLADGDYTVRALPSLHTRSADLAVEVAGRDYDDADLAVAEPLVELSAARLDMALPSGMAATQTLAVANAAADPYAFEVEVMPLRRIGLFADGPGLETLAAPLRRMGFVVELFTNNFEFVHFIHPETGVQMVRQEIRHTIDDAKVFAFDLVIADLTGPRGLGRVVTAAETDAFARYLDRGGRLIITGGNPLSRPDNEALAALCGVGLGRDSAPATEAAATADWNGRFVQLAAGDRAAIAFRGLHDLAAPEPGTEVLFTAGAASRITSRAAAGAAGTGAVWLWGGNPSAADWSVEGVWLDVLRDMLRGTFMEPAAFQTQVPWLRVTPVSGSVSSGVADLAVAGDTKGLAPGTYEAVLVMIGFDCGEETLTAPVTLSVDPHALRVLTTGSVTDWRGLPLRGDGGPDSAIYQVIYAGADGQPDPPVVGLSGQATGAPTGDDRLLAVSPTREAFGRFGAGTGVIADTGRFDRVFSVPLPPGTSNAVIYVRAWDAASFSSSLAYGDSAVRHTLAFTSGETADFGSWQVTNAINFTRDSNTNSLPDGWIMKYRPDLDPRAALTPLGATFASLGVMDVPRMLQNDPAPKPYRAVLSKPSGAFVFALDQANNRMLVTSSANPSARVFFGAAGNGQGQFAQPEGMASDPRAGHFRLAVADTFNHRVQLFAYDPDSGALTFERAFGTYGSGSNQLNRPAAVAFDNTGRVFVADKLNNRIASFRVSDGAWLGSFTGSGSNLMSAPQGLCVDPDVVDGGVWVCDTGNNRLILYTAAGVFKRAFGGQGTTPGRFMTPVDVQIWRIGARRRLCVADKVNSRVQVFKTDGTHLVTVGTGGFLPGELRLPHGVFPLTDQPELLVADTDNSRVQRFRVTLDADQDGMDDFWEDLNGLDSDVFDAYGDLDGDGLFNLAEFMIRTDPNNPDTNGDGMSDGDAVQAGLDPRVAGVASDGFTLSALPAMVPAGGLVTLALVFDQPREDGFSVTLELSGGATETLTMTRQNANTYVAAYLTPPRASGAVNVEVRAGVIPLAGEGGGVYARDGLFTVFFPSFRITSAGRTPLRLTWESVAGAWYRIETNATLQNSGWGLFTNVIATGEPESAVDLAPPASRLFFRVKRVQE